MVFIGPYHKEKSSTCRSLLWNERLDVKSCISELEKLKEDALKCYKDIEDVDTDESCQMLLLDDCFIVEFFRECTRMCPEEEEEIINFAGYMTLLENQLPFFVLDKLR